jgi:hypothetical protein
VEDGAAVLARDFENPVEAAHVDVPGHLGLALGRGGEQGGQVVDGADLVAAHHLGELAQVGGVDELERSVRAPRGHADVGCDDLILAIALAQGGDQLGADLSERSGDEDSGFYLGHAGPESYAESVPGINPP